MRANAWSTLLVHTSILVTCALAAASNGCTRARAPYLDIATTTSVQNSGLLDVLLPAYKNESGTEVRVHAAGSGRALQMLGDGLAQLVISHAPTAETAALRAHPNWIGRRLAHNWFVVVGPSHDAAGIRDALDAVDAFRRIARSRAPFVSRGDESGTHEREQELWTAAEVKPEAAQYIVSGRGMALALRHADELRAYTLSDEATFLQLAPGLELQILYRGDRRLSNVYSVIYPDNDATAAHFAEWLVTGNGRELIGSYTVAGKPAFELERR